MKPTTIICNASSPEFRARAYADYLEDVNSSYLQLISCADYCASQLDLDAEDYEDTADYVDAVLNAGCFNSGLDVTVLDAPLTLPEGYTTVREALSCIIAGVESYSDPESDDGVEALFEESLPLNNFDPTDGSLTPNGVRVSPADIMSGLNSTLHSSITTQAAFLASSASSVADRLSVFDGKISQVFNNSFNDVSNTASYFRNMLSDAANKTEDLTTSFVSSLGILSRVTTGESPSHSDLAQYTGATPVGALDFSTSKKVVTSTAKVVAATTAAVAKSIFNLGKKLFSWGKKKIQNLYDPFDIKEIDPNAEAPSIDGWSIDGSHTLDNTFDADALAWLKSKKGKWMKYELICGEVLFRVTSTGSWGLVYDYKIKPYPLKLEALKEAAEAVSTTEHPISVSWNASNWSTLVPNVKLAFRFSSMTYTQACDFLQALSERDYLYTMSELSSGNELAAYYGFIAGVSLLTAIFRAAVRELSSTAADSVIDSETYARYNEYVVIPTIANEGSSGVPSNKDFLTVVSGWNGLTDPDQAQFALENAYCGPSTAAARFAYTASMMAEDIARLLAIQAVDRSENPTNYAFLPYRDNVAGFLSSRYSIKTNSENQQALTKFLTTAVTVVVVAVVAAGTISLVKSLKRKAFWKRTQFVGQADNAMWNGQTLSARDKRKYVKYQRKLQASSPISDNLQSSSSGSSGLSALFSSASGGSDVSQYDLSESILHSIKM